MADIQKFIEELRAKVSIADVVGDKVKLVRKGREYTGLCPFHNEKTPSFTVNEAKGFYHCFGCGAHGDIVKFEMEANNLPFMEAIEKLAQKAGLEVPRISHENREEMEKKSSLYDIMEMAVKFFEKNLRLPEGRKAVEYLYNRGFGDDIIAKFRLGYAPNNNGLLALLKSKNVSEHDMSDLGLVSLAENNTSKRTFDFFRDRVIIPIFDKRGRPIAFGGRIMGDGQPKYLNSPETPIFNKRRILYNMNNARDKAFEAKNLIVCEGYMDVIALDKFDFGYAVAPLGTALTEDQIMEAWRVCPEPTLCFDGDGAGIKAAIRSVDRALPILKPGYSLKYMFLPDKLDPDEFLKARGHDEFVKVLNETKPLKDILWKKNIENRVLQTPEQKALLESDLKEEVSKIVDNTVRTYYIQDMKERLYYEIGRGARSMYKPAAGSSFAQAGRAGGNRYGNNSYSSNGKKFGMSAAMIQPQLLVRPKRVLDEQIVKFVIGAVICCPELIAEYEEKLSYFDFKDEKLRRLFDVLVEISAEENDIDCEKVVEALKQRNMEKEVAELWEFKMLRQLKPVPMKLRNEINNKIAEVQLKQIENEMKECLKEIEKASEFPEEVYKKYESLKKERENLLLEVDKLD